MLLLYYSVYWTEVVNNSKHGKPFITLERYEGK